jgi:hypothetical protein
MDTEAEDMVYAFARHWGSARVFDWGLGTRMAIGFITKNRVGIREQVEPATGGSFVEGLLLPGERANRGVFGLMLRHWRGLR